MSFRPMSLHSSPSPYLEPRLAHLLAARQAARRDALVPTLRLTSPVPSAMVNPPQLRMASTMSTPGWAPAYTLPQAQQRFVNTVDAFIGGFPTVYPMPMPSGTVVQGGGPAIAVATPNQLIADASRDAGPSITSDALRSQTQNSDTSGSVLLPDGTVLSGDQLTPISGSLDASALVAADALARSRAAAAGAAPSESKGGVPWLLVLVGVGVAGGVLLFAGR
jgi:hypothetical protein